jgi:cob(I)alamin adenosyltransferase
VSIYTRSGDAGETGLLGGARVRKDHARVEACGAVDEANAAIGFCRHAGVPSDVAALLGGIQAELLAVGADLAAPEGAQAGGLSRVGAQEVAALERAIDRCDAELPPLQHFILPAGSPAAAALHVARTVVRRAERRCVALAGESAVNPQVIAYLNRLSDLLFVLARAANAAAGVSEEQWIPRG